MIWVLTEQLTHTTVISKCEQFNSDDKEKKKDEHLVSSLFHVICSLTSICISQGQCRLRIGVPVLTAGLDRRQVVKIRRRVEVGRQPSEKAGPRHRKQTETEISVWTFWMTQQFSFTSSSRLICWQVCRPLVESWVTWLGHTSSWLNGHNALEYPLSYSSSHSCTESFWCVSVGQLTDRNRELIVQHCRACLEY